MAQLSTDSHAAISPDHKPAYAPAIAAMAGIPVNAILPGNGDVFHGEVPAKPTLQM